jgi:hypothetical protein
MSNVFQFDDPFYPVPSEVVDADPEALVRDLIHRVTRLERTMDEQRIQAVAATRDLLLDLVSLADDLGAVVDRYGVSSNAREAAIIRSVVALGKRLFDILHRQGVEPVNALGELVDLRTSDVVGSETREGVSADLVLREIQVGYTWPYGLLRRARVVVSTGSGDVDAPTLAQAVAGENAQQDSPEATTVTPSTGPDEAASPDSHGLQR